MTAARANAHDDPMSALLTEMQPRVRAFLRKLGRADLDDIAQETMARAWRSRRTFDPERGTAESWLLRIAFRAFLDQRKQTSATAPDTRDLTATGPDPVHQAAVREHTAALFDCLSPVERELLLRFHRDGESIDQIARTLAMPNGTVKSHLHRARNRLWALHHRSGEPL